MSSPDSPSTPTLARRLRFQQLLIFKKVVEENSVLAASRQLAITQPAISKSIQDLEDQLGLQLFTRGKNGMRLTEAGLIFEDHVKKLLSQLRHLGEDIHAWKSGSAGHVIIGTLIAASGSLLSRAILQLRVLAPNVKVTVRVGSNATLYPQLAHGEIDIVLGILPDIRHQSPSLNYDETLLQHVALYEEDLCVVHGTHNTAMADEQIDLQQLQQMEWIVPTMESANYSAVQQFFANQGLDMPERLVESVSILTNLELLAQSEMLAIMPTSIARNFEKYGIIKILPVHQIGNPNRIGYTIRKDRANSLAVQNFILALKDISKSI